VGLTGFDMVEERTGGGREMTDVISIKTTNANDEMFGDFALAA